MIKNTSPDKSEQSATNETILRDQLALDRTMLANERTFLAYCRTALALILTGAGSIEFFESLFSEIGGWSLIILGLVVTVIGVGRTVRMARQIGSARKGRLHGPNVRNSHPD